MLPSEYIKSAICTEPIKYNETLTKGLSPRVEHGVIGLVTESGELMDAVKKAKYYGKEIDTVNIVEEMGDLMWYMAIIADQLGVSFEEIWDKNIRKLKARYPEKFKKKSALTRDLKLERQELER